MKKLPLYLLVVIAFAGCDKKEEEDTDAKSVSRPGATPLAKAAPKSGDWMWKGDAKAKPTPYVNPLSATPKGHGTPDKYANPLVGPSGLDRKKK
ncbi:MAG: hypothetical protein ABJF10_16635 [Chthoniobacter sp.]|uniref:hypothetical protein n=1 Tax=Chthoniobacter sp. TaxID=2510640 RepID=UPI0032AD9ECA